MINILMSPGAVFGIIALIVVAITILIIIIC